MVNAAELKMATTTSTDNTGLLDALAPIFKKDTGIELKWIAVGTGNALKLGQNCDVDVLLVHAPAVEKKYVADGFGTDRTPVMYNDFVIIGDPSHKAKFEGKTIQEAFKVIEEEKIKFVSRADESGTHVKEKNVWKAALGAVPEKESWYIQAGQGMIATINIATEQKGLTFTDRGTFIKYEDNHKGNPPLVIVYEGDKNLFNYYATMAVSTKNCPNADYKGAMAFIKWISSDNIQKEIANFKLLGKQLFTPDAKTRVE
ncbi:MAG: substrate-binding domain-containing protein [Sulfurospirillaceae bacterium]|nr:substrate-binding domain-containing protein [Sulfurospirillaceae bacterium]MCK9546634.1 substrate-binding domain-containing protein [Sulfurospirillaceae bacterium]